jgi:RNA polymerase sigma-70 factor (ECF subfamily)
VTWTETGNSERDKYLVAKVLSGNTSAFATIINNTEYLVAQIVCKMICNTEDRKDLAQEIYLKVYKNLKGFRFQSRLSTWIAQIAYNACFDQLRKKQLVHGELTNDDEKEGNRGYVEETTFLIEQKELVSILNKGIQQLPAVYQTLITLYHKEEMSYAEITEITGLPEGTVKSYLFRARKTLKETLALNYQKEDI